MQFISHFGGTKKNIHTEKINVLVIGNLSSGLCTQ